MPYIKQEKRDVLDPYIQGLHDTLVELELDDPEHNNFEGNMNYIVSKLIALCYTTPSYREINDVNGFLACVRDEYNRKVTIPYETQKEHENGPVYTNPVQE